MFVGFQGNNKNEYLSLVTLSTNPPVVSHGAGVSVEASHDAAGMAALQSLADMGINTGETKDKMASGDGWVIDFWDMSRDLYIP